MPNPNDELIKLNDLGGESWMRKSITLEPIPALVSGESTVMTIPGLFLKTIAGRLVRKKYREPK